jgi:hypothetical protein
LTVCFCLSFLHLQSGKLLLLKQTSLASATTKQGVNVRKLKFVILWAITLLCRKQLILKLRVRHATNETQATTGPDQLEPGEVARKALLLGCTFC